MFWVGVGLGDPASRTATRSAAWYLFYSLAYLQPEYRRGLKLVRDRKRFLAPQVPCVHVQPLAAAFAAARGGGRFAESAQAA